MMGPRAKHVWEILVQYKNKNAFIGFQEEFPELDRNDFTRRLRTAASVQHGVLSLLTHLQGLPRVPAICTFGDCPRPQTGPQSLLWG